jgi:8-oxo-dGTP pyrophosphatase MutT (NUDIX family)
MMVWLMRLAFTAMRVQWWLLRPVMVGVRLILLQDNQVLLVRHTYTPGWNFPGGSLKRGETPSEAAAREAREEAGAELLEPAELVGIFSSFEDGKSDHVTLFVARHFRLIQATDRYEIAEVRFFPLDRLPEGLGSGARRVLRDLNRKGPRAERW